MSGRPPRRKAPTATSTARADISTADPLLDRSAVRTGRKLPRRNFGRSALLGLAVLLCASPAHAGDLASARADYERGDYRAARRVYERLAAQGDPVAQNNLGVMYFQGRGVEADDARAMEWFRRAAAQGLAGA